MKYLFQSIHIIHARFSDIDSKLNSAGLRLTWKTLKSQGICDKIQQVRGFCCLKFIFSQVEDPNFENFGLGLMVEPNLGLEK